MPTADTTATLHDQTRLPVTVSGRGRALLLPFRTTPYDEATAAAMRQWGADPDLGLTIAHTLARDYTVIAADYEGHRLANPAPETLTPANVAFDLLAIAAAGEAESVAYYGYSWLALAGLQLALRTERLWALIMGGYPPLDGPYAAMLSVTRAAHAMATEPRPRAAIATEITPGDWDTVEVTANPAQTRQFVTLYEHLQDFDDRAAHRALSIPRLTFAGTEDAITYGPRWGDTVVRIAEPLATHRAELGESGWDVELLPGLDHLTAMQAANVLPILQPWLRRAAAG
jgi:hypothetical protein